MFVTIIAYTMIIFVLLQVGKLRNVKQIPYEIACKIDFFGRKLGVTLMLGMLLEEFGFGLIATTFFVALFWGLYCGRYYVKAIIKTVVDYLPFRKVLHSFKKKVDKAAHELNPVTASDNTTEAEQKEKKSSVEVLKDEGGVTTMK